MDLPQDFVQWWTLVLGIVKLQIMVPYGQLCSKTNPKSIVIMAGRRNLLRILFNGTLCGTFWFCYPCRLSYHVPS
jgi:hypothetical protein